MSDEPEIIEEETPPSFVEYEVEGVGTVIDPEGEPGYRVRLPDGQVTAYPAISGAPSEENAADDIAHAIANPVVLSAPVVLTPLTVISRMTQQEQAAILASDDAAVRVWVGMAGAALEIRSDDPRTDQGFALLVSKGLLAEARVAELMQP